MTETVPILDPAIFGRPLRDSYSYDMAPATNRVTALKGRPRYALRDTWATHRLTVSFDMTDEQFGAWQDFWTYQVDDGAKWFWMNLMLDLKRPYVAMSERYIVHAVEGYQASSTSGGGWMVSLRVETPSGVFFDETLCDVIFAGQITAPASDDIWGGDITNLPPDIIEPCEWVQP